LFCRAAKTASQITWSVLPGSENIWNLPTPMQLKLTSWTKDMAKEKVLDPHPLLLSDTSQNLWGKNVRAKILKTAKLLKSLAINFFYLSFFFTIPSVFEFVTIFLQLLQPA
jgi:hypothetical protein